MESTTSIFDFVRERRESYGTDRIPLDDGREFSQYETIRKVNYYWANTYLDDASDEIIGDYPFDNVSKYRVLLEARATDFDTKNIEITPKDGYRETKVRAMVATKGLQQHLRDIKFGRFINDLCTARAKYGGVLCKNTDGIVSVVPWENLITDQTDIMAGIRIERHYLTPSELLAKKKVWKNTKDAVMKADDWRSKDVSGNAGFDRAKTFGDVIEVFEVQGNVRLSLLRQAQAVRDGEEYDPWAEENEEDRYEYVEAKIIACGADWMTEREDQATGKKVKEDEGIVLYAEEEETTHKYLARNPAVGRGLGIGIVEDLFQHQKWHNFTKTEEMRTMAIAGKHLFWTDDPDLLANVYGPGVNHGTVLKVGQGKTFQEVSNVPTSLPVYQGMRQEWSDSADKLTSSYASKLGGEANPGTPYRAQYLQNVEASSQFEQYREEIGFLLAEIVEDWTLPDALKKLATDDAIYASFSPQELAMIDETILTQRVNEEVVKRTLEKRVVTPDDMLQIIEETKRGLERQGGKRRIKDIKDFIKDAGGAVVVHTTDEARNKAVYFESLSNALALFEPGSPEHTALRSRIMDAIGISKEELELYAQENPQPDPAAQQPQSGAQPRLQGQQLTKQSLVGADLSGA